MVRSSNEVKGSGTVELKAGGRLKSVVCETQVIVVRAPQGDVQVACGGALMVALDADAPAGELDPALADGTQLGKRYADDEVGLELLCTKAGKGTLTLNGGPIGLKQAKPLPASD
jgi:hypothetical protein